MEVGWLGGELQPLEHHLDAVAKLLDLGAQLGDDFLLLAVDDHEEQPTGMPQEQAVDRGAQVWLAFAVGDRDQVEGEGSGQRLARALFTRVLPEIGHALLQPGDVRCNLERGHG